MDIMFINKVSLMVMVSKRIGFGTVEYIANRQGVTMAQVVHCLQEKNGDGPLSPWEALRGRPEKSQKIGRLQVGADQ